MPGLPQIVWFTSELKLISLAVIKRQLLKTKERTEVLTTKTQQGS